MMQHAHDHEHDHAACIYNLLPRYVMFTRRVGTMKAFMPTPCQDSMSAAGGAAATAVPCSIWETPVLMVDSADLPQVADPTTAGQ
jgi:hypothetical protein